MERKTITIQTNKGQGEVIVDRNFGLLEHNEDTYCLACGAIPSKLTTLVDEKPKTYIPLYAFETGATLGLETWLKERHHNVEVGKLVLLCDKCHIEGRFKYYPHRNEESLQVLEHACDNILRYYHEVDGTHPEIEIFLKGEMPILIATSITEAALRKSGFENVQVSVDNRFSDYHEMAVQIDLRWVPQREDIKLLVHVVREVTKDFAIHDGILKELKKIPEQETIS